MLHIRIIFLLLATVFLTACTDPSNKQPLRIGTNVWLGYEPLYLARELGYLEQNQVQLIEYTSATQVLRGFRNNVLDAAALTLDEAISLLDSGEQPKIILITDISNGADVLLARQGIETIEQLKGKRIGVEYTALGAYFINRIINIHELSYEDIELIQLEVNEHEDAMDRGQVDAVVTFEPVRSKLLAKQAKILFSSRSIPNEIVDVIVVKADKIEQFETQINHLKNSWYKSLDMMRSQPEKSLSIIGKRLKLSVDEVETSYDGLKLPDQQQNDQLLTDDRNKGLGKVANQLIEVMHERQLIQNKVTADDLF